MGVKQKVIILNDYDRDLEEYVPIQVEGDVTIEDMPELLATISGMDNTISGMNSYVQDIDSIIGDVYFDTQYISDKSDDISLKADSIILTVSGQDNLLNNIDAELDNIHNHFNLNSRIYPTCAVDKTVTSETGLWTEIPGTATPSVIIPTSTITSDYRITGINISNISSQDLVYIEFYKISDHSFIGAVKINKTTLYEDFGFHPMNSGLLDANDGVEALASSSSGGTIVSLSVCYFIDTTD